MTVRRAVLALGLGAALAALAGCTSSDPVAITGDEILLHADYITADPVSGDFSAILRAIVWNPESGVRRGGVLVFFQVTSGIGRIETTEVITNDDGEAFTFVEGNGELSVEVRSGGIKATASLDAEGGSIGVNRPPVARLTYTPSAPRVGNPVTFDVSSSTDPDGEPTTWRITSFGDGSPATSTLNFDSQTTTPHTYTAQGTYTVRVVVTDDDGLDDSATVTVSVSP